MPASSCPQPHHRLRMVPHRTGRPLRQQIQRRQGCAPPHPSIVPQPGGSTSAARVEEERPPHLEETAPAPDAMEATSALVETARAPAALEAAPALAAATKDTTNAEAPGLRRWRIHIPYTKLNSSWRKGILNQVGEAAMKVVVGGRSAWMIQVERPPDSWHGTYLQRQHRRLRLDLETANVSSPSSRVFP
ncbi:hypothetical protein SORBI_3002G203200 [Sorghum bicolor]|uniref:Uncharacterized protein n=1 Tax=Sorghum bicolor TaxID=4558 RepID=A0A1B6QCJ6_SORBI|nr:hypothetical protein SORBI_3002G203200 [Sorghum bicolor]